MYTPDDRPDRNDPLAPRPDDPWPWRRRWMARLYDRRTPGRSVLGTPLGILGVLLIVGLAALAVVVLLGP
jgi:hypothetical protein